MNKLQQAANYAAFAPKSINPLSTAFLAGYEAAEGAFAEWCSDNGWFHISGQGWYKDKTMISGITTAELKAIWKEQTQQ